MNSPDKSTQQKGLLDALAQAGWECVAIEELHEWWADDVWRMRSVWSPQGREFYLTFTIDPSLHLHRQRRKGEAVWAVIASATLPTSRFASVGQFELSLGHGWAKNLAKFVSDLGIFRLDRVE
jgi:hypothetical protein